MTRPQISLSVGQNEYLSPHDGEMHAVLTVAAQGPDGPETTVPEAAEVIAIDCSGSMHYPPTKLAGARRAAAAAVDAMRDGVHFAIVAGTDTATKVFPADVGLVPADPTSRTAAKRALRDLTAIGGTAMGTWLRLANRLLAAHPAAVRHVMLLTDGRNEHETSEQLKAVLAECAGRFVCDARGIGVDWAPEELMAIVQALHGTADAVEDVDDLVADFAAMTRAAMGRVLPDVRVRVRTAPFARLRFVKQVLPTRSDLTSFGVVVDARTTVLPTGAWGAETRDFHVCLDIDRGTVPPDEEVQAARVDLVVLDGDVPHPVAGPVPVRVHRTEDLRLSSVLHPAVAHYTGQSEMGLAVMAGYDAYDVGDAARAEQEWGRAIALASGLGNGHVLDRLARLVDVVGDPADGKVRVKTAVSPHDLLALAMSSVMSSQVRDVDTAGEASGPDVVCAHCCHVCPPGARFCVACGRSIGADA
ncbi:VWA domain-containing protein [Saccharothrix violaceirubra]|uniref:Ca-activated chloride channel family protein n=1 Tax=Saccharothrix violaceirubra TaxID=413306 RepID=A0A7W7WXI6_9PSEU|nr:VWA domain-containing protein [Saccharothrix violaceirubra]MBB4966663.1 Ca-activated chloride channel family protein [Saccharothrix violaceirubra]